MLLLLPQRLTVFLMVLPIHTTAGLVAMRVVVHVAVTALVFLRIGSSTIPTQPATGQRLTLIIIPTYLQIWRSRLYNGCSMLDDAAVREAFHVVLLRKLAERVNTALFRLKGGVNLRLFFGSVRYSEDMDLDGHDRARAALRREVGRPLRDPSLLRHLAERGIRGIDGRTGPNKDTETTLRYKMRVVSPGGVPSPAKWKSRSGRPGLQKTRRRTTPMNESSHDTWVRGTFRFAWRTTRCSRQ